MVGHCYLVAVDPYIELIARSKMHHIAHLFRNDNAASFINLNRGIHEYQFTIHFCHFSPYRLKDIMTMQYSYGRQRGSGAFFGVVLALLLGAVALGVFVHHARQGFAGKLAAMITGRPLTIVSAPDVVEKIQRLNRLETVVYSLDTVVESSESNAVLPDALAGDRLLMIVHGQTIAGIDMSKLQPDSVEITDGSGGRSIKLTLPASQVFVTTIDEGKSRVYTRDTGLFVKADPNLETVTRQKAQDELQAAALNDGILDAASKNARATVTAMLEGLGFAHVDIK